LKENSEGSISHSSLRLIRHGENITFDIISSPLVARISRPYTGRISIENEIRCVRYLEEQNFGCPRLANVDQPIETNAGFLTLWIRINGQNGNDEDLQSLGNLLRHLHQLLAPHWLKAWDPLWKPRLQLDRVSSSGVISKYDLYYLYSRMDPLHDELKKYKNGPSWVDVICHGDAHSGNLLHSGDGPVLIDWEDACLGPAEWDLSETQLALRRFGLKTQVYRDFIAAYGSNVVSPLTETLTDVRELKAICWLLQNAITSELAVDESMKRISSLRKTKDLQTWTPF
jgi:thiamine kinase-like enzyme